MKTRMVPMGFFAVLVLMVVAGCAYSSIVKNTNLGAEAPMKLAAASSDANANVGFKPSSKEGVDMLIEPYESLGVLKTPAIEKGEITATPGSFATILFGEYFPGRIKWNSWAVDPSTKKEFFGQTIFSGLNFEGQPSQFTIWDGKPSSTAKGVVLSTIVGFAYNFESQEFEVNTKKFLEDPGYRYQFILEHGSQIRHDEKLAESFLSITNKWNKYKTPKGVLLSPLGTEEIKTIARINPQYSVTEKLIGEGHLTISMDYIGSLANLAIETFRAYTGRIPSRGWDYTSEFPNRRNMGFIIEYLVELEKKLVLDLNKKNVQIFMRQGGKK